MVTSEQQRLSALRLLDKHAEGLGLGLSIELAAETKDRATGVIQPNLSFVEFADVHMV